MYWLGDCMSFPREPTGREALLLMAAQIEFPYYLTSPVLLSYHTLDRRHKTASISVSLEIYDRETIFGLNLNRVVSISNGEDVLRINPHSALLFDEGENVYLAAHSFYGNKFIRNIEDSIPFVQNIYFH